MVAELADENQIGLVQYWVPYSTEISPLWKTVGQKSRSHSRTGPVGPRKRVITLSMMPKSLGVSRPLLQRSPQPLSQPLPQPLPASTAWAELAGGAIGWEGTRTGAGWSAPIVLTTSAFRAAS